MRPTARIAVCRPRTCSFAAAAEGAGVELVRYDRDYERIAAVINLRAQWLVPDGTLR
ncbi:MAG: hypothetical protein ACR2NB_09990 [Solirubrobacteraceae bacterium]